MSVVVPGVYRFAHQASGYVYVGSSMRVSHRRRFWNDFVASFEDRCRGRSPESFKVSRRMMQAVRDVGSLGWRFSVSEYFPADVAAASLWEAELREIEAVRASAGVFCLNVSRGGPSYFTQWDGRPGFLAAEIQRRFGRSF